MSFTGIDKINASRTAAELLLIEQLDLIFDVRTARTLKRETLQYVFWVRDVVERDIMAEPLASKGKVLEALKVQFRSQTLEMLDALQVIHL